MVLRGASGAADTPEIPGKGAASQTYAPAGHFRVTGCGECSMWWPALIPACRFLVVGGSFISASALRIHHALILSILLRLINIFRRFNRPRTGGGPVAGAAAARAFVRHAVTVPMMATAMMISHSGISHAHAVPEYWSTGQSRPWRRQSPEPLQHSSRFMRLPWPWP
jgi:hypothetical protein